MVALSVLLLLFALLVSILSTRVILERRLDERLERELGREAEEFASLAGGVDPATGEPFGADVERILRVFLQRNVPSRNEAFLTYVGGEPFLRSGGRPPARLDQRLDLTARFAELAAMERGRLDVADVGTVLYQAVPLRLEGRTEAVFVTVWFRDREAVEIDQVVAGAGALGTLVALLAGAVVWVATGRVLRPVDDIASTARHISETDLSRRVAAGAATEELDRLVATVNAMLDRLEQAFLAQRAFVDDAGHELRTPVTVIRGNLDLLDDADPTRRRASLQVIDGELERMQRTIDDLLLLAKAERPDFLRPGPIDVDALTLRVLERARALGERDWQLDGVARGVVDADEQRVTQALLQLAANAVRHTGLGTRIAIGSAWQDAYVAFWVEDEGEGVAEEDVAHVFARFRRGRGVASDGGAGLGLTIVDSIARAHGGSVELTRPVEGGARFTVRLPACPPPGPAPEDG